MDCEEIKKQRGGRREGAGRPKGDSKLYTFRVPGNIASVIDAQENKTEFIKECIVKNIFAKHSIEEFGDVVRASEAKDLTLPFFENVSVVAMFLRIQFLEGKARRKFFDKHPPKTVYVATSRIKCAMNGDFESIKGSAALYAWFVWQKGWKGETVVRWIN